MGTANGWGSDKTICKCLACGTRFEFKDAAHKPVFSIQVAVCPNCKSERYTFLKLANQSDNYYIHTIGGHKRRDRSKE